MPAHTRCRGLQGQHRRHGVDVALARQQPGLRRALDGRLQLAQRIHRQGLDRVVFARPLRRLRRVHQTIEHALGRPGVATVRQQHAALHRQPRPRRGQRGHDLPPQHDRAPTQGGNGRLGVVQLGHRAEHAGRREASGCGHIAHVRHLAAKHRLRAGGDVEHLHCVPGTGQAPGQQAAQQASAGNADGLNGKSHVTPVEWECRVRRPAGRTRRPFHPCPPSAHRPRSSPWRRQSRAPPA